MMIVDIGNGFCLARSGGQLTRLPSIYHVWHPGERQIPPQYDQVTVDGRTYVLGTDARSWSTYETVTETNKASMALPFTLGMMYRLGLFDVDAVFSVPDPNRYADDYRKALQGAHDFKVGATTHTAFIDVKGIHYEGYGSWWANREQLPQRGNTLVIDVGAGTALALIVNNQSGEVLDTYVKESAGVIHVAQRISEDRRFVADVGEHPAIADIMQGIEEGTYLYGDLDTSFEDYLDAHKQQWFKWLLNIIRSHYHAYMSRITAILFTGGGSLLIQDAVTTKGGLLHMAKDPLRDNLNGLFNYVHEQQS